MLVINPTTDTQVVPSLIEAADDVKVVITYYQRMHDQGCEYAGDYEDYDLLQSCCSAEGHDVHREESGYFPFSDYASESARAEQRLWRLVPIECVGTASVRHETRSGDIIYYEPAGQN